MSLKNGLNLTSYYSINFDLPKRRKKLIKFVIIHYTGMKKESKALEKLADPKLVLIILSKTMEILLT